MRWLFVCVTVMLVGCGVADRPAAPGATVRPAAYPAPAAVPAPDAYPAPAIQTGTTTAPRSSNDATKYADLQAAEDAYATARARPPRPPRTFPPEPTEVPTTPYASLATPLAGGGEIIQDGQSTFGGARFLGGNRWLYELDNVRYIVHAGEANRQHNTDNPRQGMLIVQTRDLTTERITATTFYPTPDRAGRAFVTDARVVGSSMTVFIRTTTGVRYQFDVTSGQFTRLPPEE